MEYPKDFINNVICGDCIESMKLIPNNSVDIVFTSPPYNVGLNYSDYNDSISDDEYMDLINNSIVQMFRILKDTGRLYLIVGDRLLFLSYQLLLDSGFTFGQLLVWCKPNLAGRMGKINGDWNYLTEHIILCRKGKKTPMLRSYVNTHNYFVVPSPQTNWKKEKKYHPAQFPIKLVEDILSRTPGDVVLDPFCGSGTTLLVSKKLGKQFIGIDVSKVSCDISKQRLQEIILE